LPPALAGGRNGKRHLPGFSQIGLRMHVNANNQYIWAKAHRVGGVYLANGLKPVPIHNAVILNCH